MDNLMEGGQESALQAASGLGEFVASSGAQSGTQNGTQSAPESALSGGAQSGIQNGGQTATEVSGDPGSDAEFEPTGQAEFGPTGQAEFEPEVLDAPVPEAGAAESNIGSFLEPASEQGAAPVPVDERAPAPEVVDPFAGVATYLVSALKKRGFEGLTEVQSALLAADGAGRDLQVSSQTGSGKTVGLGFILAPGALEASLNDSTHGGPVALVITPTRELAGQVCDELGWLYGDVRGVRIAAVTGGTPLFRDRHILGDRPHILVGTPGRLLDHVSSGRLDLSQVREVVLDEADQMLDMGFREDLESILDATADERRMHLVSATFPDGIQSLARRYQKDPLFVEGTRLGAANTDIEHVGHLVKGNDRYAALVNHLLLCDGEKTLVFVERRADAAALASQLETDGFAALPISGDLAQSQRERALSSFRSGKASILVATDVAARGLDVPDVALVVQTSPPIDPETYTHRSGRTGRAGKAGRCLLLAPPHRRRFVDRLLSNAGVEVHWRDVPTAAEVQEHVDAKHRIAVRVRVEEALAKGATDAQVAMANELLSSHESVDVVSALLAAIEPKRRATGKDVHGGGGDAQRGRGGYEQGGRASYGGSQHGGATGGAVRFFINYGANQGANPGRILAAVCRRGGVEGHHIGSIAIHPNAATFDVSPEVAEGFETGAGRRDPRDPSVMIRRDRGPVQGGSSGGSRRGARRRGGYGMRRGGGFRRR